jgi:DNA-directed RNA polymerase specialized sigma24 family protein
MASGESISRWLAQLQAGDRMAAQKLWERYFQRLVGLARKKLQGLPRRAADEEDIALSAFASFCRGTEEGRFPQLHDRDNLWRLLVTITIRKAHQLAARERCQKRGGWMVLDEAALSRLANDQSGELGLEQLIASEPTPDFAAQLAEECQVLLARLEDSELQSVAQWKMEGFTNEEIAAKLGCALRSVERKLKVIRSLWSQVKANP